MELWSDSGDSFVGRAADLYDSSSDEDDEQDMLDSAPLSRIYTKAFHSFFSAGLAAELPSQPGLLVRFQETELALPVPLHPIMVDHLKKFILQPIPAIQGSPISPQKYLRNVIEFEPCDVTFENPEYQIGLDSLTQRIQEDLGVWDITLQPVKLLLYSQDAQVRGIDKYLEGIRNHFGVLAIQFPSHFKGGGLDVTYKGYEKSLFTASPEAPFKPFYAAFYSGVSHSVSKITSGYRLEMLYALCHQPQHKKPKIRFSNPTEDYYALVRTFTEKLANTSYLVIPFTKHTQHTHQKSLGDADTAYCSILKTAMSYFQNREKVRLLLAGREKNPECLLFKEFLPRDVFKLLLDITFGPAKGAEPALLLAKSRLCLSANRTKRWSLADFRTVCSSSQLCLPAQPLSAGRTRGVNWLNKSLPLELYHLEKDSGNNVLSYPVFVFVGDHINWNLECLRQGNLSQNFVSFIKQRPSVLTQQLVIKLTEVAPAHNNIHDVVDFLRLLQRHPQALSKAALRQIVKWGRFRTQLLTFLINLDKFKKALQLLDQGQTTLRDYFTAVWLTLDADLIQALVSHFREEVVLRVVDKTFRDPSLEKLISALPASFRPVAVARWLKNAQAATDLWSHTDLFGVEDPELRKELSQKYQGGLLSPTKSSNLSAAASVQSPTLSPLKFTTEVESDNHLPCSSPMESSRPSKDRLFRTFESSSSEAETRPSEYEPDSDFSYFSRSGSRVRPTSSHTSGFSSGVDYSRPEFSRVEFLKTSPASSGTNIDNVQKTFDQDVNNSLNQQKPSTAHTHNLVRSVFAAADTIPPEAHNLVSSGFVPADTIPPDEIDDEILCNKSPESTTASGAIGTPFGSSCTLTNSLSLGHDLFPNNEEDSEFLKKSKLEG